MGNLKHWFMKEAIFCHFSYIDEEDVTEKTSKTTISNVHMRFGELYD